MGFPEFDPERKKILFFSRGRGRGHAIPDMEIVRELERLRDDVQVRLVSYGTGARTLERHGFPLIELDLPDCNPVNETIVLAGRLIGWLDPDLVAAHEEFMALPAAKIFDKPTVFLTDWFTDPRKYSMATLRFADEILFLDEPGIYEEPEWVKGRVKYVGPVVREFQYRREDRARARLELGLPAEALVVTVLPGSWPEQHAPIRDLVIEAFGLLEAEPKRLIWMAGDDRELIRERTTGRPDIVVEDYDPQIDRIMTAADVAVTKGTRKTHFELEALGIPSVSIAHNHNPVDDVRVRRFSNNTPLPASVTPPELAATVREAVRSGATPRDWGNGFRAAATILSVEVLRS